MSKTKNKFSKINRNETKKITVSSGKKKVNQNDYIIISKEMIKALGEDGIDNIHCVLLLSKIMAFNNKNGECVASNKYFSDYFGVNERTIQRWLKELKKNEYIIINETKNIINGEIKTIKREIIPMNKIYEKIGRNIKWN